MKKTIIKRILTISVLGLSLMSCSSGKPETTKAQAEPMPPKIEAIKGRVIGYYQPKRNITAQLRYQDVSHLIYTFVKPDSNGSVEFTNGGGIEDLNNARDLAHKAGTKIILAVGGAESGGYLRKMDVSAFADTLGAFVKAHNLDGIDIDWEVPFQDGDADKVVVFAQSLRKALGPDKELSAAVFSSDYNGKHFKNEAVKECDFIGIMSYDAPGENHSSMEWAEASIKYWKDERGIPAEKLALGVPFYGRLKSQEWKEPHEEYAAAEITDANQEVSKAGFYFNAPFMIKQKVELIKKYQLSGIMIWELGQDKAANHPLSLMSAIAKEIKPQR